MPRRNRIRTIYAVIAGAFLCVCAGAAFAQPDAGTVYRGGGLCGELSNSFGPFDYRKHPDKHDIVERFHFTAQVESLRQGMTSTVGGDISYTLRAFPNHPRALYAMSRLSQRLNSSRVPGVNMPVECFFDRAVRFTPDDPQVRALYADFLINNHRSDEAREQLQTVGNLELSPQTAYNLALAWARIGEYEAALPLARQAYDGGVQYPGLRDRLERAGVWK